MLYSKLIARLVIALCTVHIFFAPLFASAQDETENSHRAESIQELLSRADRLGLADSAQWLAFLHYDRTFPFFKNSSRSLSDSFFLSPDGAVDPHAELVATITALFDAPQKNDEHAQCRFPARYEWLIEVLQVSKSAFPKPTCARLETWYAAVEAQQVTVIYPSSFLNNPASAFGHTFLRLDQKNQSDDTRLLAYAADFAASTHGENALLYAIKGIFGGFDGYFTVSPYYKKVTQYSDLENRDIWEYQLSFTPAEVRRLALHLWELREHQFTYFYFDENCSYHILALLQVARPSMNILAELRNWVIPVDTIKVLLQQKDILRAAVFRPSAATKLRSRIAASDDDTQIAGLSLAHAEDPKVNVTQPPFTNLSAEQKAQAVDLAYEDKTYETIRSHSDSAEDKKQAWDLLSLRSTYPAQKSKPVSVPLVRPDEGHQTAMVAVGVGRFSDRTIGEFTFRPAFHSLTDPQDGFLPGSQIKFFETTLRQTERQGTGLQQFTALDIQALTPRERFFLPLSWDVRLEAKRVLRAENNDPLIFSLTAGAGHSYSLGAHTLGYGFLQGVLEASGNLDANNSFGLGPKIGVIYNPFNWFGVESYYSDYNFVSGDQHREQTAMVSQRFSITKDSSLRFELSHQDQYAQAYWTGMLRLETFFTP